jgi:NAD(P)H-hydrate epimerase
LAAWGYNVFLDFFTEISKPLPKSQLERALQLGVKMEPAETPVVWIDAYMGFSQKLPLPVELATKIKMINSSEAIKISLDIPTGFLGEMNLSTFNASKILTLAAPKKILLNLPSETDIYVADLGIPWQVYERFGIKMPPFHKNSIIQLKRLNHG